MKANPLVEFEVFLRNKTAVEIANLLSSYIMENNHQGWDGFKSQDLTGVRRMFEDMMLYYHSTVTDSHDFKGDPPTNGVVRAYLKEEIKSNIAVAEDSGWIEKNETQAEDIH